MSEHLDSVDHFAALSRYLSDEIPPMLFSDAAERLLDSPPDAVGSAIGSWVADQVRSGAPLPVADYLFHAARKIHVLAELELVPAARVKAYLRSLTPFLLASCPQVDRPGLERDLANLEHSQAQIASTVEVVHRPGSARPTAAARQSAAVPENGPSGLRGPRRDEAGGAAPVAEVSPRALRGLDRLNLLLDRLEVVGRSGGEETRLGSSAALVAEIVGEVAGQARGPGEMESQLRMLQGLGVGQLEQGLISLLTRSLPDWAKPEGEQPGVPTSGAARAIERVVTLAGSDREEQSRRFSELVTAAVEQVEAGSLGRAVTLLDLAERMIAEQRIDPETTRAVRGQAETTLTEERLLELAEREDQRLLLRRVMRFFPRYSTTELFLELESETSRQRRSRLIRLLTVHGSDARAAAVVRLNESVSGSNPAAWYLQRNLVYLMRMLPRPVEAPADPEIDLLVQTSDLAAPLSLVRESVTALGQLRHQRAERTLIARFSEVEQALLGEVALPHSPDDLVGLADTLATTLARSGSRAARRVVFNHGIKRQAALGDAAVRLSALAGQDLADDPELVRAMLTQLKSDLPVKVFGLAVRMPKRARLGEAIVEALSGTDTPEVRTALADVAASFPGHSIGQTAGRTLSELDAGRSAPAPAVSEPVTLSGDLGLFGLPNLLQNLADSRLAGRLTLTGPDGAAMATIDLSAGMIRGAGAGRLTGTTAIYDLLARPRSGRFTFVAEQAEAGPQDPTETLYPMQHVLLEGMRRYDELARATAMIPDGARFSPTDTQPSVPDESFPREVVAAIWTRAVAGASPMECERALAVDAFQIRRLFEHWLEESALRPMAASGREDS